MYDRALCGGTRHATPPESPSASATQARGMDKHGEWRVLTQDDEEQERVETSAWCPRDHMHPWLWQPFDYPTWNVREGWSPQVHTATSCPIHPSLGQDHDNACLPLHDNACPYLARGEGHDVWCMVHESMCEGVSTCMLTRHTHGKHMYLSTCLLTRHTHPPPPPHQTAVEQHANICATDSECSQGERAADAGWCRRRAWETRQRGAVVGVECGYAYRSHI